MTATQTDIDDLLSRWNKDKERIVESERNIEKYKKLANKILDRKDEDTLSSSEFMLKRRTQTRTTISKADVPNEIWNKYSRKVSFQMFQLVEK